MLNVAGRAVCLPTCLLPPAGKRFCDARHSLAGRFSLTAFSLVPASRVLEKNPSLNHSLWSLDACYARTRRCLVQQFSQLRTLTIFSCELAYCPIHGWSRTSGEAKTLIALVIYICILGLCRQVAFLSSSRESYIHTVITIIYVQKRYGTSNKARGLWYNAPGLRLHSLKRIFK